MLQRQAKKRYKKISYLKPVGNESLLKHSRPRFHTSLPFFPPLFRKKRSQSTNKVSQNGRPIHGLRSRSSSDEGQRQLSLHQVLIAPREGWTSFCSFCTLGRVSATLIFRLLFVCFSLYGYIFCLSVRLNCCTSLHVLYLSR